MVFGGRRRARVPACDRRFQYPLADRVGFWGLPETGLKGFTESFSILLRIELVFGGRAVRAGQSAVKVSVSSCGSSWFLGCSARSWLALAGEFQYPLADRVGFWGRVVELRGDIDVGFSILLRIELVFGGIAQRTRRAARQGFSILLRIELVFGGEDIKRRPLPIGVSVSSCGSSWFLGLLCPLLSSSLL